MRNKKFLWLVVTRGIVQILLNTFQCSNNTLEYSVKSLIQCLLRLLTLVLYSQRLILYSGNLGSLQSKVELWYSTYSCVKTMLLECVYSAMLTAGPMHIAYSVNHNSGAYSVYSVYSVCDSANMCSVQV